jgi:hypothetical protein
VKIKLVVGERDELDRISQLKSRNGFYTFMWQLWARLDWDSGELELDDVDLAKLYHYMNGGYPAGDGASRTPYVTARCADA